MYKLLPFSTQKIILIPGGYPLGMTGKNDDGHLEKTNFINLFSETPAATLCLLRHSTTTLKKEEEVIRFYLFVLEAQQQTLPDKLLAGQAHWQRGLAGVSPVHTTGV